MRGSREGFVCAVSEYIGLRLPAPFDHGTPRERVRVPVERRTGGIVTAEEHGHNGGAGIPALAPRRSLGSAAIAALGVGRLVASVRTRQAWVGVAALLLARHEATCAPTTRTLKQEFDRTGHLR